MIETCERCHKAIAESQFERDEAIHFGGQPFCPDCAGKIRLVEAAVCPACKAFDLPIHNGTVYLCRKCGADIPYRDAPPPPSPAVSALRRTTIPVQVKRGPAVWMVGLAVGLLVGGMLLATMLVLNRTASPPPPPAASAEEVERVQREISALRAEWERAAAEIAQRGSASAADVESLRAELEAKGREISGRLEEALSRLKDAQAGQEERLRSVEERLKSIPVPEAPLPAGMVPEEDPEQRASKILREIEYRRAPLVAARRHADALAELDTFPAALAKTAAGREAASLRDAERRRIIDDLFPAERDRAESFAVLGNIPKAIEAYGEIEKRLGIPEIIGLVRDRVEELERKRAGRPSEKPPTAQEMRTWVLDFLSVEKAPKAVERFVAAGKAATDVLAEALRHESPEARRSAAIALARIRDPRATGALTAGLDDPDLWTRQLCVTALAEMEDLSVCPRLVDLVGAGDAPTAKAAHEALARISGQTPSLAFGDKPEDRKALHLYWKGWLEQKDKTTAK